MSPPTLSGAPAVGTDWRDNAAWSARLAADRERAARCQTVAQQRTTATVVERARALGAEAVALTGSTARSRTTPLSDLDLHIVGKRPRFEDLNEGLDLYATSAETLWERLLAGDDFIQWTLRYGCILFDEGVLREALIYVVERKLWPDPRRKHERAIELLAFAQRVIDTGDVDAAQEQTRAALTAVARWVLLANGEFPLARDELSDQILNLGSFDLAAALSRLIHADPCTDELKTAVEVGLLVLSLPPARARHAALPRVG